MKAETKRVIGAVGYIASGKDHLLTYLRDRYGVPVVSIGDVVRETARREDLSTDRKSLHKITEQYRALYGEDYFVRKAVERIEAKSAHTVGVSGVRSPTDVRTFRQRFGRHFILVRVSVGDLRLRYRRSRGRNEERDPQSFEEFVRQDRSERELFNLDRTIEEADLTISNNGSVEAFHALIDEELVRKELGFKSEP